MNTKYQKSYLVGAAAVVAGLVAGSAFSGTVTTVAKDKNMEGCFVTLNTLVKRHC